MSSDVSRVILMEKVFFIFLLLQQKNLFMVVLCANQK